MPFRMGVVLGHGNVKVSLRASCLVVGDGTELMRHVQEKGQGGSLVFALCHSARS